MSGTRFVELAKLYESFEHIASGNSIRSLLSKFFRSVPKRELRNVAYLTLGKIGSDFEGVNLGLAEKMVLRAIASASDNNVFVVSALFKQFGDVGLVAEKFVGKKRKVLYVVDVFDSLHEIAEVSGAGSQEKKVLILSDLLRDASELEARYVCRIVLGTLRLGVGDMTVLDSLAIAFAGSKSAKSVLQDAYNICPDIGVIADVLASKGLAGVKKIKTVIGRPVQVMLAQRIKNFEDLSVKISGLISAEEKYDGERVQVHKKGNNVVLFSRRLENITAEFPEIVAEIKKNVRARDCIIEGECVAVDLMGNLLPFQVLMQRKRKYFVEEYVSKVPVCFFVFDILNLNGKSLLGKSYPERRAVVEQIVRQSNKLQLARRVVSSVLDDVEDFFNATVARGGEGVIAKSCSKDSIYMPGKRGWLWIKWKREYAKKLADSFDLVVVGAFKGRGRRSGKYGALLCAVYNRSSDVFETLCKLGSGFSDADLIELPKMFRKFVVKVKPARVVVTKSLVPDVWFEPRVVVEVVGAELTRSKVHTACAENNVGFALRFPRFVRYRFEKSPEQVAGCDELLVVAGKSR